MTKRFFWGALALPALLLAACSFSPGTAVQEVLGSTAEAPVFLGYQALSERELSFQFSLPVKVVSLNFNPPAEVEFVGEGATVTVTLHRPLGFGEQMVADLLVEDEAENTLNVLVPFKARNEGLPRLLINELRTEYTKPKVEFVELRTETAGNLGALRLFIAGNGLEEPVFEFPSVEVSAGEYIVVHLRTAEEGCVDETGKDLSLSGGTDALDTARDFWIPESAERLRKTDVVFLMDQDNRIVDAVLLSETPDSPWAKETLAQAAALCGSQGAWLPGPGAEVPGPSDAVISKNTTLTRTICRREDAPDTNTAADWYITVNSGATAGQANNPKVHVPTK